MLLFSKLLTYLLLPPGVIVVGLIAGIVLLYRRKQRIAVIFITASCALLFLLSLTPVKDALILPLENRFSPPAPEELNRAEAIVVLGGGVVEHSPAQGGNTCLSPTSLKRVVYGYTLYKKLKVPVILTGGRVLAGRDVEPEASAARRVLEEMGVDSADIITEEQSRNTWENAHYIKTTLSPGGIILVTSAYHMPRSIYCFEQNGMDSTPAPTDYRTDRGRYTVVDFLPNAQAFRYSYDALHEYAGLLFYRLRY